MNALNWLLVIELVLLFIAAVMGLVGKLIARQDENDPIHVFCSVFWREFLWPPVSAGAGGGRAGSLGSGAVSPLVTEEPSDDDAFYGRVKGSGKADLVVNVEANAPADEVTGRAGDELHVRVTGEAGESRANKALIEMVAKAVGIKPYQVTLTKGHYQTRKTVQIQGLTPDELQARLEGLSDLG